jgi:hypothetical protein
VLMPDKHIRFAESLIGLGSFVLESLDRPRSIDELWVIFGRQRKNGQYYAPHSFENLVLAVDVLYAIGAVTENEQTGVLSRCG